MSVRNPFRRKALTGTPAVLDALRDQGWSPYPLLGGGSRDRILDAYNTAQTASYAWTYRRSPAVRTVIDVITRNIGQLDLRLYEEIDESERQPRPDHPAALSLRYPSETVTQDGFIRSLLKDYLLYDNAYALLTPAPGGQITLSRMPAHMVEIRGSSLFEAEGYRLWRRDGTFVNFDTGQVLHWRGENPEDPRVGVSKLDTLRNVIAEDVALQQATVELANSGLTQPVYGYRPVDAPPISNDARQGLEEDLANRMRRANRRPFILEEGTELRPFGVSPRDAQMIEIRRWAIERVAGLYGVPLAMVGLEKPSADAHEQFYTDTLPPYCEDLAKMLNLRILVRVYDWTDGCFEFNLDEKHMGNDRITSLVSASGRAVMTTNEARAKLNLPPIDTGDDLVTPLNVLVGENPKPSPQVMPPQDPGGPAQDGSARTEDQPQTPNQQTTRALPPTGKAETYEPVPQLHPRRRADIDRQHRYIDDAHGELARYYTRLGRSLGGQKAGPDWARWDRELSDDLQKLLHSIVEREGGIYAARLLGHDFDMRQVQNYLRAMGEGMAEAINTVTRRDVEDSGVEEAVNRATGPRLESMAAALGARAAMFARYEAARQSPHTEHRMKTWVADTDRHGEFNGETVGLDEDFSAGFEPGTAPNCRCTASVQ
jgi:HK97 family phage portal protein